jgi:Mg-chelatase subunit ChlD
VLLTLSIGTIKLRVSHEVYCRANIIFDEMRKLLTLNKDGKLSLRAADGVEAVVRTSPRNVLLLIDTSGSMAGSKIEQARNGAIDFAHSAITRSYATALGVFADRAAMVCDPTADADSFAKKIARVDVGLVGGTTDLAAALVLAGKFRELAAVVVVTDGQSNDNSAALQVAATLKTRGIDIICIGTDDADRTFLGQLATRSDLATHVSSKNLRAAITDASRFLPQG